MRHVSISLLIIVLSGHTAAAQDAKFTSAPAARGVTPRIRAAARREAEERRRRIDFLEGTAIREQAGWLDKHRSVGMSLLGSGDDQTAYLLVRRITSSKPEVHARWDDIVLVRSGTGAIEMGDSLVGSRLRAAGERTGGTFTKSHQLVVHAGDIVRIPAAVPHAFIVSGTEPLEYVMIKQRRQELPIRWFGEQR